jgi:hypothetical protein
VLERTDGAQEDTIGAVRVEADLCATNVAGAVPIRRGESAASRARRAERFVERGAPMNGSECITREQQLAALRAPSSGDDELYPFPQQVLLAYRIPAGATAPDEFTAEAEVMPYPTTRGAAVDDTDPHEIVFHRDEALATKTAEFNDERLAMGPDPDEAAKLVGDGQQLVAYVSEIVPGAIIADEDDTALQVSADFGLPVPADGKPYAGPFNALVLSGSRTAIDSAIIGNSCPSFIPFCGGIGDRRGAGGPPSFDDEIVCAGSGAVERALDGMLTSCPSPLIPQDATEPPTLTSLIGGDDIPTRDLRVSGGEGFAQPGGETAVPFKLVTNGAALGDEVFDLTSTTTVPGGVTWSQHSSDFAATGETTRNVGVKVPANATPGTYDVTLKFRTAGGEERSATGRVVVVPKPADATAPIQQASLGNSAPLIRGNVFMDENGNLRFRSLCGSCIVDGLVPFGALDGSATAAQAGKLRLLRIARGSTRGAQGKAARTRLRLSPKAKRALKQGRRIKAILVFRTSRNAAPQVRRAVIRRPRK